MTNTDQTEFNAMLEAVASMLGKSKPLPLQMAMYFRVLGKYPLDTVRTAIDAHVSDPDQGRFFPTPAHIIGQIESSTEQHPGDDEAWAIALDAADENKTVVWTDQIAKAWDACRSVLDIGDEVGARMAFKGVYTRLVKEAKMAGEVIEWNISEGFDKDAKLLALTKASEQGRIEQDNQCLQLAYDKPQLTHAPEWVREFAKRLKASLSSENKQSQDEAERLRTEELKKQAKTEVDAYSQTFTL